MRKISIFLISLFIGSAFAADVSSDNIPTEDLPKNTNNRILDLNIRRIGMEMSKTTVRNSQYYSDSPVSALNASSQDFVRGVFDTVLEYTQSNMKWDNGLFMEYGRTTINPIDGPETTDENADKILFSSDMSWSCWNFSGLKFGPTLRGAYETQFMDNTDAPRQNLVRGSGGLSLFDHKIIKSLYTVGLYEYDFTYSDTPTSKTGAEAGWRIEYEIRDGVKISTNGYYREYFSYSNYVPTDLERDLNAVVRMDTNLWGEFTMGPYIQYRRAKARNVDVYGSNLVIGISFNYITKFHLLQSAE